MAKTYQVSCKSIDSEGRGIVTFNNATFCVPYLLDGEKAKISLTYGKGKTGAKLEEIVVASSERVKAPCPQYGSCGGCSLLHMNYEKQLHVKEARVRQCVEKLRGVDAQKVMRPIIGQEAEAFHYRNKVHSTFGRDRKGKIITGLYQESTHRLIPVQSCALEAPIAGQIMKTIRAFAESNRIKIYDENRGTGVLRHVLFRIAKNGDVMVVPVVGDTVFPEKHRLAKHLVEKHPEIKTVVLNYNLGKTTMVLGKREEVLMGDGYLVDTIGDCSFRISPQSFFQVNATQTERLYEAALNAAAIAPGERVVDAYCGTGTITLLAAKAQPGAMVQGVELNAEAVRDAESNRKRNGIGNASFVCEDAGKYLTRMAQEKQELSVLLMDPPRSGSSKAFMDSVKKLAPKRIVYISCNPDTMVRDIAMLGGQYKVEMVQPVDMFPGTAHVETVVLLSREKAEDYVRISVHTKDLK